MLTKNLPVISADFLIRRSLCVVSDELHVFVHVYIHARSENENHAEASYTANA